MSGGAISRRSALGLLAAAPASIKLPPVTPKVLLVDVHIKPAPGLVKQFGELLSKHIKASFESVYWTDYRAGRTAGPVIFSPQVTPWNEYPAALKTFLAEVTRTTSPMLGICGGHQAIMLAFGGKVGPITPQPASCRFPASYDGCKREKGFVPLSVVQGEPAFAGLSAPVVWANHVEEATVMPADFLVLAKSELCKVQVVRHKTRKIYGMQFHPERSDDDHPDGGRILANIFQELLSKP